MTATLNTKSKLFLLFLLTAVLSRFVSAETEFRGLVQGQYAVVSDQQVSYLNSGTGIIRLDDDNRFDLAHALFELKTDLSSTVTLHGVLNHTINPQPFSNFSQLSVRYKPIWSNDYRFQFRAGMFYPEMGFENPDIGWLTPYNYTNSAISSWIGEELRTIGGEVKITRPGRAHGNSPHTFSVVGSIFKANDPAGSILAWRGWGLHDKQSLFNETIPFAAYPSIGAGTELEPQAPAVEPFREIDGRYGYYLGGHWDFKRSSRLRLYYYNNNGDELILARAGQYAWDTSFYSLSWHYRFSKEWRLISQYMHGNTAMGPKVVNVDFNAFFAMMSYKSGPHRVSFRYDTFETVDKDKIIIEDDNNGDGYAFTSTYRYNIDKHWQVGTELLYVDSFQANRAQWQGLATSITQVQILGVIQYRF
jgi:hypothetical protein